MKESEAERKVCPLLTSPYAVQWSREHPGRCCITALCMFWLRFPKEEDYDPSRCEEHEGVCAIVHTAKMTEGIYSDMIDMEATS
jgi:hypothetical protein